MNLIYNKVGMCILLNRHLPVFKIMRRGEERREEGGGCLNLSTQHTRLKKSRSPLLYDISFQHQFHDVHICNSHIAGCAMFSIMIAIFILIVFFAHTQTPCLHRTWQLSCCVYTVCLHWTRQSDLCNHLILVSVLSRSATVLETKERGDEGDFTFKCLYSSK